MDALITNAIQFQLMHGRADQSHRSYLRGYDSSLYEVGVNFLHSVCKCMQMNVVVVLLFTLVQSKMVFYASVDNIYFFNACEQLPVMLTIQKEKCM